jgi:sugar phosphate isomerase/epimerase
MLGRLGGEMTADEWKWNADYLNEKGRALKALGLTLGYHNHNVEFAPLGDTTGFEIMMRDTDPAVVNFEMDAGWLYAAGQDPLTWLAKHPGRFQAMHVKDVGPKTKPNFALEQEPMEVGAGVIDWRKLLPAARKAGVQRFFVEQEAPFARDPLESIAISAAYLRKLKA